MLYNQKDKAPLSVDAINYMYHLDIKHRRKKFLMKKSKFVFLLNDSIFYYNFYLYLKTISFKDSVRNTTQKLAEQTCGPVPMTPDVPSRRTGPTRCTDVCDEA